MQQIQVGSYENAEITIYKNDTQIVADGSVTVVFYNADDASASPTQLGSGTASYNSDTGSYEYGLANLSKYDVVLKAIWSYSVDSINLSQTTFIEVSTPYATTSDIVDFYNYGTRPQDLNYKSQNEIAMAERIARSIINNYTSLTFGRRTGSQEIFGIGSDAIELTERMISINQVYENGVLVVDNTTGYNNFGYPIELTPTGKAARITNSFFDVRYDAQVDVTVREYGKFRNGTRYKFAGTIGYEYVPQDIKMCTVLLAGDLLSEESSWRNKYLTDVKVGELAFKLKNSAFNGTGNVIVDGILDQYRNTGIVVI